VDDPDGTAEKISGLTIPFAATITACNFVANSVFSVLLGALMLYA
jgi:hypothetical protein